MNRKGFLLIEVTVLLIAVLFLVTGAFVYNLNYNNQGENQSSYPTPTINPELKAIASLIPHDEILLQKTYPEVDSVEGLITNLIPDPSNVSKIEIEENTTERFHLFIYLNYERQPDKSRKAHTYESYKREWFFDGLGSSACYTNSGFHNQNGLGLMLADGISADKFPGASINERGCADIDQYYVEVLYDPAGFWLPLAMNTDKGLVKKIFYNRANEIWAVDTKTYENKLFFVADEQNAIEQIQISPAYTKLFFVTEIYNFEWTINVYIPETESVDALYTGRQEVLSKVMPTFRWIDNETIVFADNKELFLITLPNKEIKLLATANNIIDNILIDDYLIYYSSISGISRYNLETKQIEPMFTSLAPFDVSPNGKYIAFMREVTSTESGEELVVVDLENDITKALDTFSILPSLVNLNKIRFLSDGESLYFTNNINVDDNDPKIFNVDTGSALPNSVLESEGYKYLFRDFDWNPSKKQFVAIQTDPLRTISTFTKTTLSIFNTDGKLVKELQGTNPMINSAVEWGADSN